MTSVTIWPLESDSGTTILNDLENITSPTSLRFDILRVKPLRREIKDSSPILCKSSITIKAGESDSPATIKLTAIDDCGTGVEDI